MEEEGATKTVIKSRRICEFCDEQATKRQSFLLPQARANPQSSAHGKDDCTWCSDAEQFVCDEHDAGWPLLDGYEWCSTFEAERFPHMFLYWKG